jgi:hypothetical protein
MSGQRLSGRRQHWSLVCLPDRRTRIELIDNIDCSLAHREHALLSVNSFVGGDV